MNKTRLAALIGFAALLALRIAELLFMTDGQGFFVESTRYLRLLPVALAVALLVVLSAAPGDDPFVRVPGGVHAAVFFAAALAVLAEGAASVLATGYDSPLAAFFKKAASVLEAPRLLELRLTLVAAALSVAAAAWLALGGLEALGRRVGARADRALRAAMLVWLWMRILCAYIFAPVNSADVLTLSNILCAMLIGLAFTRLGGRRYSDLPAKRARAFTLTCVCFTLANALPSLVLLGGGRGARFYTEIICNLLLALSALCADSRAEITAERDSTDEQKSN